MYDFYYTEVLKKEFSTIWGPSSVQVYLNQIIFFFYFRRSEGFELEFESYLTFIKNVKDKKKTFSGK